MKLEVWRKSHKQIWKIVYKDIQFYGEWYLLK